MPLFTLQLRACVSRAAKNPTPRLLPTTYHLITTMAVSFYRLGVTRRLLSYGIRQFERRVSTVLTILCYYLSSLNYDYWGISYEQGNDDRG